MAISQAYHVLRPCHMDVYFLYILSLNSNPTYQISPPLPLPPPDFCIKQCFLIHDVAIGPDK